MTSAKDVHDLINVDRSAIVYVHHCQDLPIVGEKDVESKSNKEHPLPLPAAMKIVGNLCLLGHFERNLLLEQSTRSRPGGKGHLRLACPDDTGHRDVTSCKTRWPVSSGQPSPRVDLSLLLTAFARPARGWFIPLLYLMYQRARIPTARRTKHPWMLLI